MISRKNSPQGWFRRFLLTTCLGIILLMTSPVGLVAGQYVVTKLPDTLLAADHSADLWDTVTIAGTKLSSATDGIYVNSDYWYINLGSDTIRFGTDSTIRMGTYRGPRGISIGYQKHDVTIHGGYILHDPDNMEDDDSVYVEGDTLNYYGIGVKIAGSTYNILLDSICKVNVRGAYYGSAVESDAGSKNIRLRKCRLFNNCYAYPSRTMFQATVLSISCDSAVMTAPDDYHMKVDSCYLEDNAHAAVYMRWAATNTNDRPNVKFYGDTFVVDGRNKKYVGFLGQLGKSTTQPYGIVATRAGRGTVINHCTFLTGTKYGGGRGINIIGGDGVEEEPIKICSSYFNNHEGYNQEYKSLYGCSALKIRQINKWLNVFDNVLVVTVDTTTDICGQYNPNGEPICYQVWQDDQPPFHVNIENNICSLLVKTNVDAYEWDAVAVKFDYVKYEDRSSHFRNNFLYSQGTSVIDYGQFDGGADFILTQNNTLKLDTAGRAYDQSTFNLGMCGGNGCDTSIVSLDDIFVGGASPTSVTHMYHGAPCAAGQPEEITIKRTLNIYVRGNNGFPVAGAYVTVRNNYDQLVLSGTTSNGGRVSGAVSYLYYSHSVDDSTDFNPFTIEASSGDDHTEQNMSVNWNSHSDTLTLLETAGSGEWGAGEEIDTIPPAPVMDLHAESGSSSGSIALTWTATGDDGNTGTASWYDIKYSVQPLNYDNWEKAQSYSKSPVPSVPGNTENCNLTNLTAGQLYYIALRAYDDVENVSSLSNVVSAVAAPETEAGILYSPAAGAVVNNPQPTLVVINADTIIDDYSFQVAPEAAFSLLIDSATVSRERGSTTSWQVSQKLAGNCTYFWRAAGSGQSYESFSSFKVELKAYAYPNPFIPARSEHTVFTGIPVGADLILTTVSGDIIKRWTDTDGSDIAWDGTSASGNPIASGVYLWYVKGTDQKGKIAIIR